MGHCTLAFMLVLILESPGTGGRGEVAMQSAADSIQARNNEYVQAVRAAISGKEEKPAAEVFKNVNIMKTVPAGRLLNIMNFGFSRSLGVSCTHCHVEGRWESDDKPAKRIAREMSGMVTKINKELLPSIADLGSENPIVNCTTCHRGQRKPALDLPR